MIAVSTDGLAIVVAGFTCAGGGVMEDIGGNPSQGTVTVIALIVSGNMVGGLATVSGCIVAGHAVAIGPTVIHGLSTGPGLGAVAGRSADGRLPFP